MSENTDDFEIHLGRSSYEVKDPLIKIAGVGTLGCNIIHELMKQDAGYAQLIAMDTDECWLGFVNAPHQVQLGKTKSTAESLTRGLGAGGDENIGRNAAAISMQDIKQAIKGADVLFILGGLGGGTGSGAVPLIAEIARNAGALTIALVVMPLERWGQTMNEKANKSLSALSKIANVTIVVPDDKLLSLFKSKPELEIEHNLEAMNTLLYFIVDKTVASITYFLKCGDIVNIDPDDLKEFCKGTGYASIGFGVGSSPYDATRIAINCPLLHKPLGELDRYFVLIKMGKSYTIQDTQTTFSMIYEFLRPEDISRTYICGISGSSKDPDEYNVTFIALDKREDDGR